MNSFYRLLATLGVLAPYIFSFIVGVTITYVVINTFLFAPVNDSDTSPRSFIVGRGWSVKKTFQELENQKYVKHWRGLELLNAMRGRDLKIKVGEYKFSPAMSPADFLNVFEKGDVVYHDVTIPEGTRLTDIAKMLASTTLVTEDEASVALSNPSLRSKLEVPDSFEGYLFPDTYRFTVPETADDMITRMVENFRSKVTQEMLDRAAELDMSLHKIVTLASVIEKESARADERPIISAVFHNRLRIGMPLQSDPTVIYGLIAFDGNLTREHLNTPHLWNTYLNVNLPPTPICSPGLDSIKAALYPADVDFLYFVATGEDGKHIFSSTFKEHREYVKKYQQGGN